MELICREELQLECRSTGRQIEDTILAEKPQDGHLPEERLDNIFKPLIDSVEKKTELAVRRELDEEAGRKTDRAEEDARQDIIDERRTEISERCHISVNGKITMFYNCIEKFKLLSEDCQQEGWQEFVTDCTILDAPLDLYDADDDDLIEHDEYDSHWDDYIPTAEVTVNKKYEQVVGAFDYSRITEFVKDNSLTPSQTVSLLKFMEKYGLSKYQYYVKPLISMARAWRQDDITQKCPMVIKSGKRKHGICGRPVKRRKLCSYHVAKK